MASALSKEDIQYFGEKLRRRLSALREQIQSALSRTDSETYAQLAGQVHDIDEESLADLLVDINLAEITREVQEIRDIDSALRRVLVGTYGICVDCDEPIPEKRLQAYPSAKRCLDCQRAQDHATLTPSPPKL
jgi:RNA polymerase-binding transcription factor